MNAQEQLGKFLRDIYGNHDVFQNQNYRAFIWSVSQLADALIKDGNTNRFNSYEVHPCHEYIGQDGRKYIEVCEPEQAEFWTVYGRYDDGMEEAIHDFKTLNEAQFAATNLRFVTL